MDSVNSVAYVKREIDKILYGVRTRACAYVNHIIYGTKSLVDLLKKLCILFNIFLQYNISINPSKSFLNNPNVRFLGQRVNSLGLTTLEEKLKTIKHLTYPETLGALEYYFGQISYFQSYIYLYAQLATPIQALKISFLYDTPVSGQQRRAYASRTKRETPSLQEMVFFQSIQDALTHPSTLMHYNPYKTLWIDLDTSKGFGFRAVVFHTTTNGDLPNGGWPTSSSM